MEKVWVRQVKKARAFRHFWAARLLVRTWARHSRIWSGKASLCSRYKVRASAPQVKAWPDQCKPSRSQRSRAGIIAESSRRDQATQMGSCGKLPSHRVGPPSQTVCNCMPAGLVQLCGAEEGHSCWSRQGPEMALTQPTLSAHLLVYKGVPK